MARIILAGGTGNLGKLLSSSFLREGHDVFVLTRQDRDTVAGGIRFVKWDAETVGDWVESIEGVDVLINLCGESINTRFTRKNKAILRDSRIRPTTILGQAITTLRKPPRLWINFSGISLFENVDGFHDETSRDFGSSFLAELTKDWETMFNQAVTPHTKKSVVRISPVLTRKSGMFAELLPLVKMGLGGQVGNGKQYISWIHERDLIQFMHWIVGSPNPRPVYHACSPFPETNAVFMQKFRQAADVSFSLPLPTLLARVGSYLKGVDPSLLLGSVSATTVAGEEGFKFDYPYLNDAFRELMPST